MWKDIGLLVNSNQDYPGASQATWIWIYAKIHELLCVFYHSIYYFCLGDVSSELSSRESFRSGFC